MRNKYAIVTLAVGSKYYNIWKKLVEPTWKLYANNFGYDIICFKEPLDKSERAKRRSVSWQKCLILEQEEVKKYERVVWLDSDIIINPFSAPCIFSKSNPNLIGAVNAWEFANYDYNLIQNRMISYSKKMKIPFYNIGKKYFEDYGLEGISDKAVQGGMLILTPHLHNKILLKIYNDYEDNRPAFWHYEMRPLSYELIKNEMVDWIDYRFNYVVENHKLLHFYNMMPKNFLQRLFRIFKIKFYYILDNIGCSFWEEELCNEAFISGYFIHFAGNSKELVFAKYLF